MDTLLFGIGLLVAIGAFFILIQVSKVRHQIQQNIDNNVKENVEGQEERKKSEKAKRSFATA